jgi:hypothetical protein
VDVLLLLRVNFGNVFTEPLPSNGHMRHNNICTNVLSSQIFISYLLFLKPCFVETSSEMMWPGCWGWLAVAGSHEWLGSVGKSTGNARKIDSHLRRQFAARDKKEDCLAYGHASRSVQAYLEITDVWTVNISSCPKMWPIEGISQAPYKMKPIPTREVTIFRLFLFNLWVEILEMVCY